MTLHIGPVQVRWYSLWLVVCAALALSYARPGALGVRLVGLVTVWCVAWGRAGYVLTHADAFAGRPLGDWLRLDGISEHVALVAGLVLYPTLARLFPEQRLDRWWIVVPLTAIGAAIGCIPEGCAAGREVFWQIHGADSLAWQVRVDWPDPTLTRAPRLPTQLLTAGWSALYLLGLLALRWRFPRLRRHCVWLAALDFWLGELLIAPLRVGA